MSRFLLSVTLVAGCGFAPAASSPDGGHVDPDGTMMQGDTKMSDATACYGTGLVTVCFTTPPQPTLPIGPQAIDTMGDMCAASHTDVCLLAGVDVTVTGTVTAAGKRPLVIVATHTLTINGTIDVSSKRIGSVVGAAADSTACNTPGTGVGDSQGSSGGAGGSFGSLGGSGGNGNTNFNSNGGQLRLGGTPGAVMTVTALRGGCRGADGGDASANNQGGTGGSSGGAVYLIAGTQIQVATTGRVYASGAGGGVADGEGGGAGAGTGGLIGFDAPTITIDGIVAANGGAGSGGSGTQIGGGGEDGTTSLFTTQANGGGGSQGRGDGGDGTGGSVTTAQDGMASDGGGGGGGGGLGVVWVKGALTGMQISPAPSLH